MQDITYLEKIGGKSEDLRKKFEVDVPDEKIKKLLDLHRARINDGVDTSIREAPIYGAIDRLLETAQNQIPYIQARELASSGKSHQEVLAAFKAFKLDKMLTPVYDEKTGDEVVVEGKPLMTFNQPLFEQVMVPLVAAYADMRANKLFLDRNVVPRYKYSPPSLTAETMISTEIVTHRVQRMNQEMNYGSDDLQSIKNMSRYGSGWGFPRERWYKESYTTEVDGKPVDKTQRSGVRFIIPHPRRVFYDRAYPAYTINSDTGVSFAGYWDVRPYREIVGNSAYWNTDKVSYGGYSWFCTDAWRAAAMFYPCQIEFPENYATSKMGSNWDTQKHQTYLATHEQDSSVATVALFHKLIPKDWGLFDYNKPVWMRFIYAGCDTVIHAEVLPYTPAYVMLDRYDSNSSAPNSLALALAPFQQMLGNFLTQHFISVKQNLVRVAWVNSDVVEADALTKLKSLKDRIFQGLQFISFSKRKLAAQGADQREAATTMSWPAIDVQQIKSNIELVFAAVERVLGFSPQEVGAAASHEQSAQEITVTSGATSVSVGMMGDGVDRGISAKKRLLYEAFVSFDDDEVFAEVADITPEREAALKKLGFEIEPGGADTTHVGVRGKKASLVLDSFIAEREGVNRIDDSKVGIAMLQSLSQVASNPVLFQTVGPKAFLELFQYIFRMLGLPTDFRIKPQPIDPNATPEAQQQQLLQLLKQARDNIVSTAVQQAGAQVQDLVVAPLQQKFAEIVQALQALAQKDKSHEQVISQLVQALQGQAQKDQTQDQALVQLAQQNQAQDAALGQVVQATQALASVPSIPVTPDALVPTLQQPAAMPGGIPPGLV